MVLATDRLLHERLVHLLAVDHDRVVVFHRKVGSRSRLVDAHAETLLDLVRDALVKLRTTVSVAFEASGCRDANLVEDLQHDSAVPEDFLQREIVHADRLPELDIRDCVRGSMSAKMWASVGDREGS